MFSKSVFPFLGVVIGGATGGIGGAIAGFFIAAIIHGALRGLYFRLAHGGQGAKLDKLLSEAGKNPEISAKIHQLATLKRIERVVSLYESGGSMPTLATEEQQAYIILLEFMRCNSPKDSDKEAYNDFLHKIKAIHFKGNSVLGSHLSQVG